MCNARFIFKRAATLILMTGLVYSQVCNVLCSFVERPASVEAVQPIQPIEPIQEGENSHCHHQQSSDNKSQSNQNQPQKPGGSHDCPMHEWLGSRPSEISKSGESLQKHVRLAIEASSVFSLHLSNYRPVDAAISVQFHPPPQNPQRSILRI